MFLTLHPPCFWACSDLWRVDQRQGLDVLQDVLDRLGLAGDAVALIEAELVAEGVLAEPDTSEGVEETFVQVVCHPAAILDLTWVWHEETESGGSF